MAGILSIGGAYRCAFRIDGTLYVPADTSTFFGFHRFPGYRIDSFVPESEINGSSVVARSFDRVFEISGPVYVRRAPIVANGSASFSGGYLGPVESVFREYDVREGEDDDGEWICTKGNYWERSVNALGIVPAAYQGGLSVSGLSEQHSSDWGANLYEEAGKQSISSRRVFTCEQFALSSLGRAGFFWEEISPTTPGFKYHYSKSDQFNRFSDESVTIPGVLMSTSGYE